MSDYNHDIEKYIKGELTPAERNALERKALHDPFLADALEGAEQIKPTEFSNDVVALNKKLTSKKIAPTWMWPARIAAGLAILAVSTFIIWSIIEPTQPQELALEKNEPSALPPDVNDSTTSPSAISSAPVEQPTAGPAVSKDLATRSTYPSKAEAKPKQGEVGEALNKNEPVTEALAITKAEEKADELKVTEPIAQAKSAEREAEISPAKEADVSRAKTKDDVQDRKAAYKKAAPSERDVSPAAADKREAGLASSVSQQVIRGQVTSVEDGAPLPGVNVVIKGSTIGTTTDVNGNYQIETTGPNQTLGYGFIGFKSTEVDVKDKKEVNVQLAIDATALSEVVVVGYGTSSDQTISHTVDLAHPETGNRAFKQYLEKNIRYPEQAKANKVSGRVTVEFTIESNGSLTNFIVIRGIGSGCDEELIRLIKDGPRWVPTKKDDVPVQDKAKVRLKFEVPR